MWRGLVVPVVALVGRRIIAPVSLKPSSGIRSSSTSWTPGHRSKRTSPLVSASSSVVSSCSWGSPRLPRGVPTSRRQLNPLEAQFMAHCSPVDDRRSWWHVGAQDRHLDGPPSLSARPSPLVVRVGLSLFASVYPYPPAGGRGRAPSGVGSHRTCRTRSVERRPPRTPPFPLQGLSCFPARCH